MPSGFGEGLGRNAKNHPLTTRDGLPKTYAMEKRRPGRPRKHVIVQVPAGLGKRPCTEEHLNKMPIFARGVQLALRPEEMDPSYRPKAAVFELALNGRALRAVESLGVKTIGELLTVPMDRLLEQWGFGPTSLDIIHGELRRLLLDGGPADRIDLSSFESFAQSLISMTTDDLRDVDILHKRLGLSEDGVWSLGRLAEKYGLTRERIRQIEASNLEVMSRRARREILEDFWREVFGAVAGRGGRCDLAYLALELTRIYNWPAVPNLRVLPKIIELRPELRVDPLEGTVTRW